jgi:hypothetical protein
MPYLYYIVCASCPRARARVIAIEAAACLSRGAPATSYPVSGGRLGDHDNPVVGTFAEIRTMGAPSTRMG